MKRLLRNNILKSAFVLFLLVTFFSFNQATERVRVKKITIYYTPFKVKLRIPIKANEIVNRSEYKLVVKNPEIIGLTNLGRIKKLISELKDGVSISIDSLFVRSKIIFDLEKGKDIVMYVAETKYVYYNGFFYAPNVKINEIFENVFSD